MTNDEAMVGLPGYEVTRIESDGGRIRLHASHKGPVSCPSCGGTRLRSKGVRTRTVRHESWGERRCELLLETRKHRCLGCGRHFWQRFPGILPHRRASEPFRRSVARRHWDGISRSRLALREGIGGATVERWFQEQLVRRLSERKGAHCPKVLGIDEHFFTKRLGYATTFCDLGGRKVFDVVLGRSEASLEGYLSRLKGKDRVEVVCIDLSRTYRSLAKKHFPNARIVADRFHAVRLANLRFLACWKLLDPEGARNRGLLSLMRRHPCRLSEEQERKLDAYFRLNPAVRELYRAKQDLHGLLLQKNRTKKQCRKLIPLFMEQIGFLRESGLEPLVRLGETLLEWAEEIVRMWRFTKNNGITEGFHNKMECLSRQAYGFRNFENYRRRVRVLCGGEL
ncbi:MAG: ISL3 family transposase [Candidatus Micrarchaeota archaeon]